MPGMFFLPIFRPECQETVDEIQQHPCLQGVAGLIVKEHLSLSHEGSKHLSRIYSCPNCSQSEIILSTPTYPSCSQPSSSLPALQASLESFSLQTSEAFSPTTSEIFPLSPSLSSSLPSDQNFTLSLANFSQPYSRPASPNSSQSTSITLIQPSSSSFYLSATPDLCHVQCSTFCSMDPDNGAQIQCPVTWSVLIIAASVICAFFWE